MIRRIHLVFIFLASETSGLGSFSEYNERSILKSCTKAYINNTRTSHEDSVAVLHGKHSP